MTHRFDVIIEKDSEGYFVASVPALPGCHSQGETREEALENIREAAELWLEVVADTAAARSEEEDGGCRRRDYARISQFQRA